MRDRLESSTKLVSNAQKIKGVFCLAVLKHVYQSWKGSIVKETSDFRLFNVRFSIFPAILSGIDIRVILFLGHVDSLLFSCIHNRLYACRRQNAATSGDDKCRIWVHILMLEV